MAARIFPGDSRPGDIAGAHPGWLTLRSTARYARSALPARPDLKQLKHQAKDLLRALRHGDAFAVADFAENHPERVDATTARLADAQRSVAIWQSSMRSWRCRVS